MRSLAKKWSYALAFLLASPSACSGSVGGPGGGGAGGGGGGGGGGGAPPCECANFIGSLTLDVLDATSGAPIEDASFAENGATLHAQCTQQDHDAGVNDAGQYPCTEYVIYFNGHHVVTVGAPGYTAASVTTDIAPPGPECCASGAMVQDTVRMTKVH